MKKFILTKEEKGYIAGILDGYGSINAQIIKGTGYRYQYRIRVTITFHIKTKEQWFLIWLKRKLRYGFLKKRNDGISQYVIVSNDGIKKILLELQPYLKLKKRHSVITLDIINNIKKVNSSDEFIEVCKLCDKMAKLNGIKTRSDTSLTVKEYLLQGNITL